MPLNTEGYLKRNILSSEQEELLKIFSTPSENKFLNVRWDMSEKKLPKIRGVSQTSSALYIQFFQEGIMKFLLVM